MMVIIRRFQVYLPPNFFLVPSLTPTRGNPKNLPKFFQVSKEGGGKEKSDTRISDLPRVEFFSGGGLRQDMKQVNNQILSS